MIETDSRRNIADNVAALSQCAASQELVVRGEGQHGSAMLAAATHALAHTNSFEEIKGIRDRAEAVRVFARAASQSLELQNKAAELKLRAERKAGAELRKMKLRGGDRKSTRHNDGLKLVDLGLTETQSARWQRESLVPEELFCSFIASAQDQGREITTAGLLKLATLTRPARHSAQQHIPEGSVSSAASETSSGIPANGKDMVNDLLDHHRLLTSVLQPACERGVPLAAHSRRVVRYLLNEIVTLLERIRIG